MAESVSFSFLFAVWFTTSNLGPFATAFFSGSHVLELKLKSMGSFPNVQEQFLTHNGHNVRRGQFHERVGKTIFSIVSSQVGFGDDGDCVAASHACAVTRENFNSQLSTSLINDLLYPDSEINSRYSVGASAQRVSHGEVMTPDDPRLSLTYAEFPLHSFEILVKTAEQLLHPWSEQWDQEVGEKISNREENRCIQRKLLVDLGSGTGRLVLYWALAFGGSAGWDVHGIEISSELHSAAVQLLRRGIDHGYLHNPNGTKWKVHRDKENENFGKVCFHLGSAEALFGILGHADIVFAYSTAWPAKEFCVEYGAPMLGPEWSKMLRDACKQGCSVVTTDRVLNPKCGWVLVETLEVENPDLLGSVGYIHVLEK